MILHYFRLHFSLEEQPGLIAPQLKYSSEESVCRALSLEKQPALKKFFF